MSQARNGKRAVHNWANMPPEILRLVLANCLAYKPQIFPPSAWLHPNLFYQRCVFDCLRDAQDVQRIMRVCPQWHNALLHVDFWVAACKVLDPEDCLKPRDFGHGCAGGAAIATPGTIRDYNRFCYLLQTCCIPCRINRPRSFDGIGATKSIALSVPFGYVSICKNHKSVPFCGVCLMDYGIASRGDHNHLARVPESLFQNEDYDTWPGIQTTCFHCRRDALLKSVTAYSSDKVNLFAFIGGTSLESGDYEARSIVDSFVEMAEGGINDVIGILLERHWLHANTSLDSFLAQAVASVKFAKSNISQEGMDTGYESEEDMLSDDDEESYDMLQSQEEGGIRDLAIAAWARTRILDGNWVTPIDMWFARAGQLPHDSDWKPDCDSPTIHPVYYLLESQTGDSQMTESKNLAEPPIHYPASDVHAPFPSQRFAQLILNCFKSAFQGLLQEPLRHIVAQLFNQARASSQDPCVVIAKVSLDDVLVFLKEERVWYIDKGQGSQLQHAIPYVPVSTENMPPMTRNLLQSLWREACQPVFACQCSICRRAIHKQAEAQGARVASQSPVVPSIIVESQSPPVPVPAPRQIVLEDAAMNTDESSQEFAGVPTSPVTSTVNSPVSHPSPPTSRKRGSAELDDPPDTSVPSSDPIDSPRKRQRTGEKDAFREDDTAMSSESESPLLTDGGDGTAPGSPTHSPGLSSETGRSCSSTSDSSSLRSIPSDEPLSSISQKNRAATLRLEAGKSAKESIQIHGSDEEPGYGGEGIVRFMT